MIMKNPRKNFISCSLLIAFCFLISCSAEDIVVRELNNKISDLNAKIRTLNIKNQNLERENKELKEKLKKLEEDKGKIKNLLF